MKRDASEMAGDPAKLAAEASAFMSEARVVPAVAADAVRLRRSVMRLCAIVAADRLRLEAAEEDFEREGLELALEIEMTMLEVVEAALKRAEVGSGPMSDEELADDVV